MRNIAKIHGGGLEYYLSAKLVVAHPLRPFADPPCAAVTTLRTQASSCVDIGIDTGSVCSKGMDSRPFMPPSAIQSRISFFSAFTPGIYRSYLATSGRPS